MDIDQPRPFDLDEERRTPALAAFEQCEADWMVANGKTLATMTAEDLAALRIACPLTAGGEHRERRG